MANIDVIRNTLDRVVSAVGELPAAPSVISAAIRLTSNLESNITEVCHVLASDQSLTARVLKLSNSPYYGRCKRVATLQEALVVLGFQTVRSLIIATSAHGMFRQDDPNCPESKLWRHSLATAIAARLIAEHIRYPEKEEVFVGALLHDIGKLVLMQKMTGPYGKIINEVERKATSFKNVESQVLGFDHSDVASLLLEAWSFPGNLVQAVRRHHQPQSFVSTYPAPIAQVINLANYMAKNLGVGFNDERVKNFSRLKSARISALDKETLDPLFQKLHEQYQTEVRIFEQV
ncbi:MAG: HDOD domain-containing protein [Candidatus Zixiibacteriota bacterium]|nr:MAG: HDOD domain-containing protein [candidate division Zixibacteria bacterium]